MSKVYMSWSCIQSKGQAVHGWITSKIQWVYWSKSTSISYLWEGYKGTFENQFCALEDWGPKTLACYLEVFSQEIRIFSYRFILKPCYDTWERILFLFEVYRCMFIWALCTCFACRSHKEHQLPLQLKLEMVIRHCVSEC